MLDARRPDKPHLGARSHAGRPSGGAGRIGGVQLASFVPGEIPTTLDVHAARAAAVSPAQLTPPAIEVAGLVKRYRKSDRNAVDGISFAVPAGEFFALLGPNGAGKTTTLSILTTTLSPTEGAARIDGYDVVADAPTVRRRDRPRVLFLDEPTTGLDAPSRRALWGYLRDVRREHGTTIVLTSHYLEEAEQADRICIIDSGRIVATGSPADLTAALANEWLLVDADDRARLRAELVRLGHSPSGDGPFRVDVGTRDAHATLRSIETPLTLVRTHAPSLEDAYLEIVSRAELTDG